MTDLVTRPAPRASRYGLGRMLVIDDTQVGELLAGWLEGAGFDTVVCDSSEGATRKFVDARPDVVFAPAAMATPDGVPICVWIRERSDVLMVATTPRGSRLDPLHAFDQGADLVIQAPMGGRELVARVRALLRRMPAQQPPLEVVIHYAGLALDIPAGTLSFGDVAMSLDACEVAALALLVRNGRTITRRVALAAAFDVAETDLDSHVRRLRLRLEAVEGWRRLVSLRGVGFRLLERPEPDHFIV